MQNKKIAIYTSLFGNYDNFKENEDYSSVYDYYIITDLEELKTKVYKKIIVKPLFSNSQKNSRFYKINGHEDFKNYDYLIYHDSNFMLKTDAIECLVKYAFNNDMACFSHSVRSNVYDELLSCLTLNKEKRLKILKYSFRLYKENIKIEDGLFETGIMIINVNNYFNKQINRFWWYEINKHTIRDQLSLPLIKHKYNINIGTIFENVFKNDYSINWPHNIQNFKNRNDIITKVVYKFILIIKNKSKKK